MPSFTCQQCKKDFSINESVMAEFPGWVPKVCMNCKNSKAKDSTDVTVKATKKRSVRRVSLREENLTLAEVLETYTEGPKEGVFTDGSADPNPGPGGWGAVYVKDGKVIAQNFGHDKQTTNNRMELTALIQGCRMIPIGTPAVMYSDSLLCVNTCTTWAEQWEAKGWKRKKEEIKNLDLVKELYGILKQRPEIRVEWIKAHSGTRWNEYADSLATAYRREERVEKIGERFDVGAPKATTLFR